MCFNALSHKLEKDFSYLQWRAQIHQHSSAEVAAQFGDIINNYRPLVAPEDLPSFEALISHFQARL